MRTWVVIWVLLVAAVRYAAAQDQERKLLDRLLKPDTTLQSAAQNKKFSADGSSIHKKATVGSFYVQEKSNSKVFSGTRKVSARQFDSQAFPGQRTASGISERQAIANRRPAYASQTAPGVGDAPQSQKKLTNRSYADNRPFLDQGKSQKSLTRKNKPLTIDEVRELLNRNK